jgi:hypothetical protein
MNTAILPWERDILRERARLQREYAESPENEIILAKWQAQAEGRRDTPTVRLLFSNFYHEVVSPRLKCESDAARMLESTLLGRLVGRELFEDDTPISPTFDLTWRIWAHPFNISPKISRAEDGSGGYHIDPVITDLETEFDKLEGATFGVDREATMRRRELAEDVFGDILPTRMVMDSLCGHITNPLVHLMGMEAYYLAMYDCPDKVHAVMEMGTSFFERFYDFLEEEKLLLPTNGISAVAQESFAFTDELPSDNLTSTSQCWGFLESQETTAVAPETFGEFVYSYQQRLVNRFGLLSYGCCERVDALWLDYLSKWDKLRKLSVSPFNNEQLIGDYLRGSRIVYYSKPRAELVTLPGNLDEQAIMKDFRRISEAASGCLFEVAQREVGTIYGDFERGRRYVQLAREAIAEYWQP